MNDAEQRREASSDARFAVAVATRNAVLRWIYLSDNGGFQSENTSKAFPTSNAWKIRR